MNNAERDKLNTELNTKNQELKLLLSQYNPLAERSVNLSRQLSQLKSKPNSEDDIKEREADLQHVDKELNENKLEEKIETLEAEIEALEIKLHGAPHSTSPQEPRMKF